MENKETKPSRKTLKKMLEIIKDLLFGKNLKIFVVSC
jgi:hypothetical protein